MPTIFTLLRNRDLSGALHRYVRHTRGWMMVDLLPPILPASAPGGVRLRDAWPPQAFDQVADQLEAAARAAGGDARLLGAVVVVDLGDDLPSARQPLAPLNPMDVDRDPWTAAVAMLVMAFPEMHWVFYTANRFAAGPDAIGRFAHTVGGCSAARLEAIVSLLAAGVSPLFDPTNLRHTLRAEMRAMKNLQGQLICDWLPMRQQLSVSVDEEAPYAFLTAYAAFRFGYRAAVLSTYAAMRAVLGKGSALAISPCVSFEDLFINTPDKPHDLHLSNLEVRDEELPRLLDAKDRVLVTGNQSHDDPGTAALNDAYVTKRKGLGVRHERLPKPLSGIYDLWTRSNLPVNLPDGVGPGFQWPPSRERGSMTVGGHSAPGRLLCIANRLVLRSAAILHSARSVPEAIYAALLAIEAVEHLGHRTPTASLAALSLQHRAEVTAECMFQGVEQNLDVRQRQADLMHNVESISSWMKWPKPRVFIANAELALGIEILRVFREFGRFDEEQKYLRHARDLNRQIWFWRNLPWTLPIWPFRWYMEFLLGGVKRFVALIAVWTLVLGVLFGGLCDYSVPVGEQKPAAPMPATLARQDPLPSGSFANLRFYHGMRDGVTAFFGLQPPHDTEISRRMLILIILAVSAGFAHLGIFVSHLYLLISRR